MPSLRSLALTCNIVMHVSLGTAIALPPISRKLGGWMHCGSLSACPNLTPQRPRQACRSRTGRHGQPQFGLQGHPSLKEEISLANLYGF